MAPENTVFKALRQQMLWPSIHAAVDVYFRRRTAVADHYELIWRLIHVCECTIITLASTAISRVGTSTARDEFLRLRERCYGISWNSTDCSLENSVGALDGSIDKWIEILQLVSSFEIESSPYLTALTAFLARNEADPEKHSVDISGFARAWSRACDVPPNMLSKDASVLDTFLAINAFRNRFAHVPFPYDQIEEIYRELEACTFRLFEITPGAANDQSPLSGYFANREAILKGTGHCKSPESYLGVKDESFVWGKLNDLEIWDAKPFILLDKMLRPYLLSRLKNDIGSWEYIRFLAEANAVHRISDPNLFRYLPRPIDADYPTTIEERPSVAATHSVDAFVVDSGELLRTREDVSVAIKNRNFEPAIQYLKKETDHRPQYHSAWHRLGYAQRELAVDTLQTDRDKAKVLFHESIESFTRAAGHTDPQYAAEALYNRSKSHWRLAQLLDSDNEMKKATADADKAVAGTYDHRFMSWRDFLSEDRHKFDSLIDSGHGGQ